MIIQSQFKDYYDYVQHVYGGGDPKIVYERKRLVPLDAKYGYPGSKKVSFPMKRDLYPFRFDLGHDEFRLLFVAGKLYVCVCVKSEHSPAKFGYVEKLELLSPEKHVEAFRHLTTPFFGENETYDSLVGEFRQEYVEFSKAVGAPVFLVKSFSRWSTKGKVDFVIDGEIPILSELGLPSVYPPEQLYQDLSYFIGNQMRPSPDLDPPANVSDKDRIVQHGFDLKQSFRHRRT